MCEKTLSTKKSLRIQMKYHDKSYQCEVCLKFFGTKQSLLIHMRKHNGEKPYVCLTCDKRFSTMSNLKRHQATHSDERKFKCEICPDDRYFKTKLHLKNHMKFHYEPTSSVWSLPEKFSS